MMAAAVVLLVGSTAAPFVFHHYDVADCFLTWSRASGGAHPSRIYLATFRTACDYPPVVPYLLTLVERLRLAASAPELGALAVIALKLPSLLAAAAHVPLALWGLAPALGWPAARRGAMLLALSPALFVNAALWGQFDALLSFFVLASVVAAMRGRLGWAGAALGAGLATKLLAVVLVPVLAVFILRRHGARGLLQAAGCGALAMCALALPFVLGGAAGPVLDAYRGAVDYYPFRTVEAYNGWYLLDRFDIIVRGMPARAARLDTRVMVGAITFRHAGLFALFAYTAGLILVVARRPTPRALLLGAALQYLAFFMLPTQMHQRYVLPAAVLFAAASGLSRAVALLALALTVTATLNQGLDLARAVMEQALIVDPLAVANPPAARGAIRTAATAVAVAHVALFAWATLAVPRAIARADDAP